MLLARRDLQERGRLDLRALHQMLLVQQVLRAPDLQDQQAQLARLALAARLVIGDRFTIQQPMLLAELLSLIL